jgi:hypothetical protein
LNETSACALNTGFRALQSYRELFTPSQFDNYSNYIICILCISLCFTSVIYIFSRCRTVPDYICCIYAVLVLKTKCFVYSLFIKIKLLCISIHTSLCCITEVNSEIFYVRMSVAKQNIKYFIKVSPWFRT